MKKILLIEDEPILGETLTDVLETTGFEVNWVKTIDELNVELDKQVNYNLICSDFHLPDGTLVDVWHRLRNCELLAKVPVLVMSATASEEDTSFINNNFEHILPKPFMVSELEETINSILHD